MRITKFLLIALVFITFGTAQAQDVVRTTTTTRLPEWGVAGNDKATYYYIPDIESYYDVNTRNYVYMDNGRLTKTTTLPPAYVDYDLYSGYKVVLTDSKEPYDDFDNMRVKYAKGFKGEPQKTYKVKKNRSGKVKMKEK
jgi:hypothetical protein